MLKKILLGIAVALILMQFIRPEKNLSDDRANDISTKYQIPDNLKQTLQVACNDCHSNKTEYPWYSNLQPVAWMLADHVNDGKRHLNFSTFTKLPIAVQNHKLEEIAEQVEEKEMPLESYTYLGLHKEANLTPEQRQQIVLWAKAQMETLKATYPADSLVMKRKSPPKE